MPVQAFVAGFSAPAENLGLLERLIRTRADMAGALGAASYAQYALRDATLAGSPEAVQSFLLELAAAIRPKVGPAAHCYSSLPQALNGWLCMVAQSPALRPVLP